MIQQRKPRRIRIAQCTCCGGLFRVQRRSKLDIQEGVNIQTCTHCFWAMDGKTLPTTLEEPAAATESR